MRIGVLGASGYVGMSTYLHLKQSGHEVTPISRSRPGLANTDRFVPLDDFLKGEGSRLEVLVNCIGLAHGRYTAKDYRSVEVELLRDILSAAERNKIGKFIHISSIAAQYGKTPYGQYKREGEAIVARHGDRIDFIILRPTMIYGESAPGHPAMLRRFLSRNLPVPFGSIGTEKSVLYIKNLTHVIGQVIAHDLFERETYSVSDPGSVPFNVFIEMNREAMGSRSRMVRVPPRLISGACAVGEMVDRAFMRFPLNRNLLDALMSHTSDLQNNINARIELPYETAQALGS